jgi:hypothetical protein
MRLLASGVYTATLPSPQPLAWVLNSDPAQHLR